MSNNIFYGSLLLIIIYLCYVLRNYYIVLEKEYNAKKKLKKLKKEVYHVSNVHEL
jgi:hypothetical protein